MKIWKRWKRWVEQLGGFYTRMSLGVVILVAFTVTAAFASSMMGTSFYSRFSSQMEQSIRGEYEYSLKQSGDYLTQNLQSIMKVFDAIYFDVIKNNDFSQYDGFNELNLLYNANKDKIQSIALFSIGGEAISTAPASILKENTDVSTQKWYLDAVTEEENKHFSMPHVQNLFVNTNGKYEWVVSLSQLVNLNYGNEVKQGILVIDMKYDVIEDGLKAIKFGGNGYAYLTNKDGVIIYHPQIQLLHAQGIEKLSFDSEGKADGNYEAEILGVDSIAIMKTVAYTGWKMVGVMPDESLELSNVKSNIFLLWLFLLFFTVILLVNLFISMKITSPILKLEKAVKELAEGNLDIEIPSSGFFEIWHLENSIRKMSSRIRKLMDDVVEQQESLRKSELDVLQSQINPHFLYNTLDIIVWLIENKKHDEAVGAVTSLARFFRISLSKGRAIITVQEEIEHIRNYLAIQELRYKNKFIYMIELEKEVASCETIKLILQPIVENAIYHALEYMEGDGVLKIIAKKENEDLLFIIEDNGLGMTEEKVRKLQSGEVAPSNRGSGIGVCNVQQRLRGSYGNGYGLTVESEPDVGTKIFIKIPIDNGGRKDG